MGFADVWNLTIISIVGTLVVMVAITVLIVGVIVWAIRRVTPAAEDPAVSELKRRLAVGEISPVEYEVRMRALDEER